MVGQTSEGETALDYPYPADESSDCTYPDEINLKDKKQLLAWKFNEGEEQISNIIR